LLDRSAALCSPRVLNTQGPALFQNTPAGGDPSGFASFTQNRETKGLRGTRSIP
jgi:hypothetical protein